MGLEYPIIRKYKVPHGSKERIVDTFVWLHFKKHLPEYYIQNMGDKRLDVYLKQVKDLENLESIVKKVLSNK
jgi:transcription-repair coupling factor (superfamily II helicase)